MNKFTKKLKFLYGEERANVVSERLSAIMEEFKSSGRKIENSQWLSEEDIVLISYGDNIKDEGKRDLEVLRYFLRKYFNDVISIVHILPFFPYSSDDGFSIKDYEKVDEKLGDWEDIARISEDFDLMFDAVINHISAQGTWFKGYLRGNDNYKNFFISVDPDQDLSEVTRPRAKPLLTTFDTDEGEKHLWTTFSADQVDLNFKNEEVLLKIIKILLLYVQKGARVIRLDAIAYLWKEIGTSCIHLEETHTVVQLFREIFEELAPEVLIITETNVPHQENISYFGNDKNEAHLVYQFCLPPLVMHSFAEGNAVKLSKWASALDNRPPGTSYFNFLASHDGIGVRPVEGILSEEEVNNLLEITVSRGGNVSYKSNSDGSKDPYELNISYYNAIIRGDEDDAVKPAKFVCSQSILLSIAGVPGIYIHSLLGSNNYNEGVARTGKYRTINREKLDLDLIEKKLADKDSLVYRSYKYFTDLIRIRKREKAFHPNATQKILSLDDSVFSILRTSLDEEEKIIALHNVSSSSLTININLLDEGIDSCNTAVELVSSQMIELNFPDLQVELEPYQVKWIKFTV